MVCKMVEKEAKKFCEEDKLVGRVEESTAAAKTTTIMATSCMNLKEVNYSTTATDRLQNCSLQRLVLLSTPQAGKENKIGKSSIKFRQVKKQNLAPNYSSSSSFSPNQLLQTTNSCILRGQAKQKHHNHSNSSAFGSNVGDEFEIGDVKPEEDRANCSSYSSPPLPPYCSQSSHCCCYDHRCFTSNSAATFTTTTNTTTTASTNVFVDLKEQTLAKFANKALAKATKNSEKQDREAMLVSSGCEANQIQRVHYERFRLRRGRRSGKSSDTNKQQYLKGKEGEKEEEEKEEVKVEERHKFKLSSLELQIKSPHRKQQKHYNYKLAFVAKTWSETPKFSKRAPELFQTLVYLLTLAILANSFSVAESVDCFKCSSRNGSNPACEDPFHNLNTTKVTSPFIPDPAPLVIYHSPCYAGKKGREGLFPASACIKLTGVFDTTGETLVVRHCALDSGTLTQDTELARMSHCGKFQFEGDLLKGCVLACPEDACNSAPSNRVLRKESITFLVLALVTIMAYHLQPLRRQP